jgi:tetratricopeptide (TPR) repeat protein
VNQRWQKIDRAAEFYESAAKKNPDELAYFLAHSEMLVALGRQEEALRMLQDKVVYFENSAVIRDAVGELLMQFNKYTEAADMLRQATILDSKDDAIREHYVLALYAAKQHKDALQPMARLLKNETYAKRADLWLTLGQCQIEVGQVREARQSLETASRLDPQNASICVAQGRVSMQQNDLGRAEQSLKKALTLDPARGETRLLLGYLRLKQGKPQEALANFQKASALDPKDTTSLCMIGYALQKLGRGDDAVKYYAKALKISPGDEMASRMMASTGGD